jgi:PAS domain S-box-containing protein
MGKKTSYEELEQKVKELENVSIALRKAESALRENEERYRLVFDNAIVPMIYFDLKGKLLLINTVGARNLDGTADEMVGKTAYDIIPQFADEIFKRIRRAEETGRGNMYEDFIELPQGAKCFFTSVEPVRDSEGTINGVQMICVDITERKEVERALEESEEKYRLMAETASIGIYQLDAKGKIVFLNDAYVKILGYNKAYLLDRHLHSLLPEKDIPVLDKIFEEVMAGKLWKGEVSAKHKLGHKVPVNITMVAMKNDGIVLGVHGSMEDITERKCAEEELIESKKELEIKSIDLEDVNTALRVLLRTREEDKKVLEEKVMFSVKDLIMPYIEKLKMSVVDQRHQSYLDIIDSNLNDIVSPFMTAKATEQYKLTPTQIHVANFVKQGKSTKEIAEILYLSTSTIDSHRNTIRKKLGITNKNVNLRSFLLSRDTN